MFRIASMDCASEENEIRHALRGLPQIRSLRFLLAQRILAIDAAPDVVDRAVAAIRGLGFEPEAISGAASPVPLQSQRHERRHLARLGASLVLAIAAELVHGFAPATLGYALVEMGLAITAIALVGLSIYRKGFAALRQGRLNINALMSVAVSGAFLIGQWPEAAMVMALYALAESIEAKAVQRARQAIAGLLAMAPEQAEVRQGDGQWRRLPSARVAVGDVIRIRPGERLPLDGAVITGMSSIDQAPVTGESLPVEKGPGDGVFAGTVNQGGALEIRVSAPASESTLARIIDAVEEAQATRAPSQRFVDRFAARYTPAVFLLACAVAVLAPFLLGVQPLEAIYKALVLLVIACPCALVIATPVTVVSGMTAAARSGIVIKGGLHLEQARRIQVMALDKTGTITAGRPKLVAFEPIAAAAAAEPLACLAASLAERSDHPVSKATAAGLAGDRLAVEAFEALPGRGVRGRIGGQSLRLANHRWIEELGLCSPALEAAMHVHERQGRSVSLLAGETTVLAMIAVADTVKPSSRRAIAALRAMGVRPVMLTGDNDAAARSIAAQAGIEEVRSQLLPADKLKAVVELQQRHGFTAMAGDGINDAPALARSDLGMAMGGAGSDTAMEVADVVIMNDDLMRLPETIALSRRTFGVLWQNIALALGIKALFLVFTLLGSTTMWEAVFADMGTSLLVIANGLRLIGRPPGAAGT